MCRHRASDGVVKTKVQSPKLRNIYGFRLLCSKLGDDLAEVPIVMYYLIDAQPMVEEIVTVLVGAVLNLGVVEHLVRGCFAQSFAQLIQKHG